MVMKREVPEEEAQNTVVVEDKTVKKVKVRVLEDHKCNIAGNKYILVKDSQVEVPSDVATILANSNVVVKL